MTNLKKVPVRCGQAFFLMCYNFCGEIWQWGFAPTPTAFTCFNARSQKQKEIKLHVPH
jgi:hypothetical protein